MQMSNKYGQRGCFKILVELPWKLLLNNKDFIILCCTRNRFALRFTISTILEFTSCFMYLLFKLLHNVRCILYIVGLVSVISHILFAKKLQPLLSHLFLGELLPQFPSTLRAFRCHIGYRYIKKSHISCIFRL